MSQTVEISRGRRLRGHGVVVSKTTARRADRSIYSATCECGDGWDSTDRQWLEAAVAEHLAAVEGA